MGTYVLVHGAWHTGKELEPVAAPIRAAGHTVHTPTIKGNRPGDPKTVGLDEAIQSIGDYVNENDLRDAVLVGHSYGGMIVTGVADRVQDRVRRLVYWNAIVPDNGECLNDMVPPHYVSLFDSTLRNAATALWYYRFPFGGKRSSMMPTWKPRNAHTTSSTLIR
jgi:pimeloyl-ACP methyl ester carboxylesterase